MNTLPKISILGLQGDIEEHFKILKTLETKLGTFRATIAKTKEEIENCNGIIIPGGESTTMNKLIEYYDLFDTIKNVPCILGTCAGAILLAKKVHNAKPWQKFLGLVDIEIERNAYGTQTDSFSESTEILLGDQKQTITATFIRAPIIRDFWGCAKPISQLSNSTPIAIEQQTTNRFFLALTFHPELETDIVHKYFITKCTTISIRD